MSTRSDGWAFENDPTQAAFMLLAYRATQDPEATIAAITSLIRTDEIDGVAYALGAGFAELARPGRDRRRPFINSDLGAPTPLPNDSSVATNSIIAAAANRHRGEAMVALQSLSDDQKVRVVSLLLDLVLIGIRRRRSAPWSE